MAKRTEIKLEVIEVLGSYDVDEKNKMLARVVSWNDNDPIFEIRPVKQVNGETRNGPHVLKVKPEMISTVIEWLEEARTYFFKTEETKT